MSGQELPRGKTQLNQKIRQFARQRGLQSSFAEALLANLIFLELAAVQNQNLGMVMFTKGGTGIALSNSLEVSRLTTDLDLALDEPKLIANLFNSLSENEIAGFSFIGSREHPRHSFAELPEEYLVQRIDVQIGYLGRHWRTVRLETSVNEFKEKKLYQKLELASDIEALLGIVGIKSLGGHLLISNEYQFAQKLHALSTDSRRGRDLYDLWLLITTRDLDTLVLEELISRVCVYRKGVERPGQIQDSLDLTDSYEQSVKDLKSFPDRESALRVVNDFLGKLKA